MSVCDKTCRGCEYFYKCCNYLLITGHPRGCPAGAGCIRRKERMMEREKAITLVEEYRLAENKVQWIREKAEAEGLTPEEMIEVLVSGGMKRTNFNLIRKKLCVEENGEEGPEAEGRENESAPADLEPSLPEEREEARPAPRKDRLTLGALLESMNLEAFGDATQRLVLQAGEDVIRTRSGNALVRMFRGLEVRAWKPSDEFEETLHVLLVLPEDET